MSKFYPTGGGAGGLDPDELTAVAADVRKGKIAGVKGSDDPVTGTLDIPAANILAGKNIGGVAGTATSDANATAARILNGYTAYVNGSKIAGNVVCNSILNFSAQAYSGRQILLKWQNPYAATGKPFSGVFINYATGSYPGKGGTRIYTGYGSNYAPGGWSQVVVTLPAVSTTYYFSCTSYSSCSVGDLHGTTMNSAASTQADLWITFTYSQGYTIPAGYATADICCVGGGGGGVRYNGYSRGGGGGGGYVAWGTYSVSGYYDVVIGAGAAPTTSNPNGDVKAPGSSFGSLISAAGGMCGNDSWGGWGGSGGGATANETYNNKYCGAGGSDGTYGSADGAGFNQGGRGSGTTTKAFGWGTLYSGGGGGGGGSTYTGVIGGAGGAGGGGHGSSGTGEWRNIAESGTANTGGGGGGGGTNGAYGGSGVVIMHLY